MRRARLANVIGCLVAVATVMQAAPASGGLVTWEFTGEITSVKDTSGLLGGAVVVGTPFSGSFTFESTTFDSNAALDVGWYANANTDISGFLGGLGFSGPGLGTNAVSVTNGAAGSGPDRLDSFGSVDLIADGLTFWLSLIDSSGTAFVNDDLPVAPPDLNSFDSATIRFLRQTGDIDLLGEITSLTPDPSTLSLLVFGSLAALRRRRS